jgi:MFS family permease
MINSIELEAGRPKRWQALKLFLPAVVGTIVEYYDYALYGFCAVLLAQEFFPTSDPTIGLLKTFGVFVAGSLSKPIGALIFGTIGDKIGRRVALKISIIGIAIPTTLIGLMPTYNQIGWWAPFLLLICRILQGMFVSGEYDGVRIFIFESVGKKHPNFANSLTNIAGMLGYYLASVAASWVMSEEVPAGSWRIPFIMSGVMGLLVFWYRCSIQESLEFIQYSSHLSAKTHQFKMPTASFLAVLLKNKRAVLATILLFGAVGGGYHFYFTFLTNYLCKVLNVMNSDQAAFAASKSVLVYTVFGPIAGWIADRFGAVKVFKFAAISLLMLSILNGMMIYNNYFSLAVVLFTASVLPFFHAPGFVVLIEKFKIDERYRCISFGHSVGSMIFSGSAPLVGLWIWQSTGMAVMPFVYFAFLILMGYLVLRNE